MSVYWKKRAFKSLCYSISNRGGRSSDGKIAVYHRGGGVTRIYRRVDYIRSLYNVPAFVFRLEYNPLTHNIIALLCFANGITCYILAPEGLRVGSIVQNSWSLVSRPGCSAPLHGFPIGSFIHNLELNYLAGAQALRASGSYGRVMSKLFGTVVVMLRSGHLIHLNRDNLAVQGVLCTKVFTNKSHTKAGFIRSRGWRPSVRGVAMNPVDHPHGGGEGKSGAGRPSVSRWGWLTKNIRGVFRFRNVT